MTERYQPIKITSEPDKNDELPQGMGKVGTTLTINEEGEKKEDIQKNWDKVDQILKEKFGYTYGDPLPDLSGEDKIEFDSLVAEMAIYKKKLEK